MRRRRQVMGLSRSSWWFIVEASFERTTWVATKRRRGSASRPPTVAGSSAYEVLAEVVGLPGRARLRTLPWSDALSRPDPNLLFTLDVLLAEGNVARAARRLRLSPSAMSRALARLREATGNPLPVRARRGLVASPRALELRESISRLVHDAETVLRPAGRLRLDQLERTLTVRASEGFVENFGARLLARIAGEASAVHRTAPIEVPQQHRRARPPGHHSRGHRDDAHDQEGAAGLPQSQSLVRSIAVLLAGFLIVRRSQLRLTSGRYCDRTSGYGSAMYK